jgi:ABC-type lipoprotein export system ATPase subunit
MKTYPGSQWRKWDLHVHTPMSLVQNYGDPATAWSRYLDDIEKLPEEIKVLGINDYIFIDGYRRVVEERKNGRLKNIDLVLPVIELRLDKFGGSGSQIARVNFHAIFSDQVEADAIQTQFLSALHTKYHLLPEHDHIHTSGLWYSSPTPASLAELGKKIIESVPAAERGKFKSPMEEGFNSLCFPLEHVLEILEKPVFHGKCLTAIGKTEWAAVRWNDNTIAEKKNIINKCHFVFTASASPETYQAARTSLKAGGVNHHLLDCSDAHDLSTSKEKDRLGNCSAWIKGDPVFETLRQALFDFEHRVSVELNHPLMPFLRIEEVKLKFPEDALLVGENAKPTPFCFRGEHRFRFSPYLTCIIGGRGAGKSTLLNLLHEKLQPGKNPFFKTHWLDPKRTAEVSACVAVDGDKQLMEVEFILQNEVEQFAVDPSRLTSAIFGRLRKLDTENELGALLEQAAKERENTTTQAAKVKALAETKLDLALRTKELERNNSLVQSFTTDEYVALSRRLGELNREAQSLKSGKDRYQALLQGLRSLMSTPKPRLPSAEGNAYDARITAIQQSLETLLAAEVANADVQAAEATSTNIQASIVDFRARLDRFLTERGLSQENQGEVGKATEAVASLNAKIPALRTLIDETAASIAAFAPAAELPDKYAKAIGERLAKINLTLKDLSTEVKPIVLTYEFDAATLNARMLSWVMEKIGSDEKVRIDHVESVFEQIDFTKAWTYEPFVEALREDGKTAKMAREFFAERSNFELAMLEAWRLRMSFEELQRIEVTYDGRPIDQSSFGQRCTAAIVILILLGNNPIVIDEPEAHLDSALIARYLVDLVKRTKRNRQVIFATHNANFVVNGDAELITLLDVGPDHRTTAKEATIENLEHRARLLGLEGGREAFRLRERRYGIGDLQFQA